MPLARRFVALKRAAIIFNPGDAHNKLSRDYIKSVQMFDRDFKKFRDLLSKNSPMHNQKSLPLKSSSVKYDDLQADDFVLFDANEDHEAGFGQVVTVNADNYVVRKDNSDEIFHLARENSGVIILTVREDPCMCYYMHRIR